MSAKAQPNKADLPESNSRSTNNSFLHTSIKWKCTIPLSPSKSFSSYIHVSRVNHLTKRYFRFHKNLSDNRTHQFIYIPMNYGLKNLTCVRQHSDKWPTAFPWTDLEITVSILFSPAIVSNFFCYKFLNFSKAGPSKKMITNLYFSHYWEGW